MRLKISLILYFFVIPLSFLHAQLNDDVYFVQFTDKVQSIYTLNNPSAYLSTKAIQRRIEFNIAIDERDLPINQNYVDEVIALGARIKFKTKWLNGVGVTIQKTDVIETIRQLPFVSKIEAIHLNLTTINIAKSEKFIDEISQKTINKSVENNFDTIVYGAAWNQIRMINGDYLHKLGFRGKGMDIAVIDNGFLNADHLSAFDSLRIQNRILSSKDFIKNSEIQFNEGSHGTKVLSIMAANVPGIYVGTAPQANYHLIRTEIEAIEALIEEYFWLCGAEYADSCGADIINSSLGYTRFDNPNMDHEYSDLDGNSTIVTQAADIAASKGILVVTSAGNYANKSWQFIGAPADGDSVLSIGAVDENRNWAVFSSLGPTADGRIKPNVVAQGQNTAFIDQEGDLRYGNGTSFSSPIVAGLAACLWQTAAKLNNAEIMECIEKSSDRYHFPDMYYGYGLPDFSMALQLSKYIRYDNDQEPLMIKLFPNPFIDNLKIIIQSDYSDQLKLNLFDVNGKSILSLSRQINPGINYYRIEEYSNLMRGFYFLQLKDSRTNHLKKVIKF